MRSPELNIDVFARPGGFAAMRVGGACVTVHFRDEQLDMCLTEYEARVFHRKLGEVLGTFDKAREMAG